MAALRNVVTSLLLLSVTCVVNIECIDEIVDAEDPALFKNAYDRGVDLMKNRIAIDTVTVFLEDVKVILDNQIAHEILTGISATFKIIFSDPTGHETVIAIADGITDILKDKDTEQSIEAFVNGMKTLLGNPNAMELCKLEFQAFNEIIELKNTPRVIDVVGAGFTKILNHKEINNAIKNSFDNIIKLSKSYNSK